MIRAALLAAFISGLLLLAGCQVAAHESTTTGRPSMDKRRSVEITPSDDEFSGERTAASANVPKTAARRVAAELTAGELLALPKFTVTQKGFRKLGLSVVTNTEVARGGPIEWMRVGVVLPGSTAARQGLFTGIEIFAINGVPVAQLSREDMLHALFERSAGEPVRLLLYSRHFGSLPLFVTL